jgi:hypothetical protein
LENGVALKVVEELEVVVAGDAEDLGVSGDEHRGRVVSVDNQNST